MYGLMLLHTVNVNSNGDVAVNGNADVNANCNGDVSVNGNAYVNANVNGDVAVNENVTCEPDNLW